VTVTVNAPVVAVLLAVRVSTLEVADAAGLNEAVTPLGSPVAVKVTLPVNPPVSVTMTVSVSLAPCLTDTVAGEDVRLKPATGKALTVSAMVVLAVVAPEVPVIVTVTGPPVVAVLLAVSVSTLEVADEVGLNEAVTPLGRPVAAKDTAPVNPPVSVTVTVSVVLLPWVTDAVDAEGARLKPDTGKALTVRATVVLAVVLPDVPVMVTVTGPPTVAVLLAVSVSTLEVADEVGLNEAVKPLGRPVAVKDALPVNPSTSATEMVSVALLPWVTDKVEAEGERVKLGVPPEPEPTNVVMLCAGSE
jgi:hypothetical protein